APGAEKRLNGPHRPEAGSAPAPIDPGSRFATSSVRDGGRPPPAGGTPRRRASAGSPRSARSPRDRPRPAPDPTRPRAGDAIAAVAESGRGGRRRVVAPGDGGRR